MVESLPQLLATMHPGVLGSSTCVRLATTALVAIQSRLHARPESITTTMDRMEAATAFLVQLVSTAHLVPHSLCSALQVQTVETWVNRHLQLSRALLELIVEAKQPQEPAGLVRLAITVLLRQLSPSHARLESTTV